MRQGILCKLKYPHAPCHDCLYILLCYIRKRNIYMPIVLPSQPVFSVQVHSDRLSWPRCTHYAWMLLKVKCNCSAITQYAVGVVYPQYRELCNHFYKQTQMTHRIYCNASFSRILSPVFDLVIIYLFTVQSTVKKKQIAWYPV